MTEDEMHADKGDDWKLCGVKSFGTCERNATQRYLANELREAMHDRDRYMAEAAAWREEAERLRAELGDMNDRSEENLGL